MELLAILGLLWAISKALIAASWTALQAPVRGPRGGTAATKHIMAMAVRTFFETVSIDQFRYAYSPDTSARLLETWARCTHTTLKKVKLPDGTTAFWLGNPDAERLLLHLPGGAYCLPALPSHIDYSTSILKGLGQAGIDAGMLFLPYELTPTAQYPHQMKQAVALLQYVIEDLGKRPSDIVLLGDSAGAHLILSVLSHLAHPHPHIPPLLLPENLAGALLLSPWMGESRTDYDSCRRNASRDLVSLKLLIHWADMFLGDTEPDSYNQPAGAPGGWWRDLPVEEIFIGVGGHEILYDSIIKTARKIKAEHTGVTIGIAHLEVHCEALSPFNPGMMSPDQYRALLEWLKGSLRK